MPRPSSPPGKIAATHAKAGKGFAGSNCHNFDRMDSSSSSSPFRSKSYSRKLRPPQTYTTQRSRWHLLLLGQGSSPRRNLTNTRLKRSQQEGSARRSVESSPDRPRLQDEGLEIMPGFEGFRRGLSAFVLWCISLVLYLGGALLLLSGLIFSARAWWALVHQQAGLWAISATTAEVFVLATAFFLILIIPILQHRGADRKTSLREERRSEIQKSFPVVE